MKRVLLDVHTETQFRELVRVARLLVGTGRYTCTFCHTDASPHALDRFERECAREGFPLVAFDRMRALPRWAAIAVSLSKTLHVAESCRRGLALARSLLDEQRPSLVLMGEDGMGGNRSIIHVARKHSIPIAIVPYEFSTATQPALAITDRPDRQEYGMDPWLNRLAAWRYPRWVHVYNGEPLLRAPGATILVEEMIGLAPPLPWTVHGGWADQLAAESSLMREHYVREGLPAHKITVTGALYHDELRGALDDRNATRRAIAESLGLDPRRRLLVCAIPPSYVDSRTSCDFKSYRALLEFWIGALLRVDHADVVFQLHPAISGDEESEIVRLGAKVSHENIATLIAACDALVTSASSIIRMAIACGRPVLNYDVYRFGYRDYDAAGGVLTVQEQSDFLRILESFAVNDELSIEAAANQAQCATAWGVLDGQAGRRMLALFDELTRDNHRLSRQP